MRSFARMVLTGLGLAFWCGTFCQAAEPEQSIPFQLHACTFDFGESINRITFALDGVDAASLDNTTFTVTSTATLPDGIEGDEDNAGLYENVQRSIDRVSVTDGMVELVLHCENGGSGEGTLSFGSPSIQRNMDMELLYTVQQTEDLIVNGEVVEAGTLSFTMEEGYDNPEVAAFQRDEKNGMTYFYYVPENAQDGEEHPLIVWLHGLGEGGYPGVDATTSGLRANRAALGFAQADAQAIFGGAFVLAPQSPTSWIEDYFTRDYETTLLDIVDTMTEQFPVDTDRIYLTGASAGGYAVVWLASHHPEKWAAVVPVCPGISTGVSEAFGSVVPEDEDLLVLGQIPVWVIQAANDTSVSIDEAGRRLSSVLGSSIHYTEYSTVNINGTEFDGHWSWVYLNHNVPECNGQHIWNWMAEQVRSSAE